MMINKRLIEAVPDSKKYIAGNVVCQWFALAANIVMMTAVANLFSGLYYGSASINTLLFTLAASAAAIFVRAFCTILSARMSYFSSKEVKRTLREEIYTKLLKLGTAYNEKINTSEVVQVTVEGVEQLETYFGAYLPQFFYALLAPLTLFAVLMFVNAAAATVLIICVPLIPVAIAAVQTWAKKLLGKYWGQYAKMGDTFLENLQGLVTLKIYGSDEFKNKEMNEEAEKFRKITMKVLTMQLNSITIMDLIAYGGAALGIIIAAMQFENGNVTLGGCILIIFLAADFFIPMRTLGSFFHVAMNGMAASEKIFRLLDLDEAKKEEGKVPTDCEIKCLGLRFSYEEEREILHGIDLSFPKGGLTAIVGASGCGKSTIASILTGKNKGYSGEVYFGEMSLKHIDEASLMDNITYIGVRSYLFKGSVRENLLAAKRDAKEEELWEALERVKLAGYLKEENGLDTLLTENAGNLSGGQRQRLALARALLHDSQIYIFDEATSNIDIESENDIISEIKKLSERKTVILISHRLANVVDADKIYVLDGGSVAEEGTHELLLSKNGLYRRFWDAQLSLENYGRSRAGI